MKCCAIIIYWQPEAFGTCNGVICMIEISVSVFAIVMLCIKRNQC